jgi:hypothetical protein
MNQGRNPQGSGLGLAPVASMCFRRDMTSSLLPAEDGVGVHDSVTEVGALADVNGR